MRIRSKTVLLYALIVALAGTGTVALLAHRAAAVATQTSKEIPTAKHLSLQPEALKVARQLGARFLARKNTTFVVNATLTIGSEARAMQMTRRQAQDRESVEVAIEGSPRLLTWDAKQGVLTPGRPSNATERELIERLVFDGPDQFVLMQFRGASYYTVARAVRPVDAPDGYDGPIWTIVRTDDPEQDEAKRPVSRWRLYYINSVTSLIDRIECEVHGQRIVAEISSWTEQNGEKVPAQIVWTRDGQTLMQYTLTSFSQSQN